MIPGVATMLAAGLLISSCRQEKKPQAGETEAPASLKKGVILVDYREKRRVDVFLDGDIFTSCIYPSGIAKPVLFPVRAAGGTGITRGYPLEPRQGERVDHPHHAGVWFAFGDVNGYDFWNSSGKPGDEVKARRCRVLHRGVKRAESREDLGVLETAADWQTAEGDGSWRTILQEQTVYEFSGGEHTRTIDRITQLTAQEEEVVFSDSKEGLFAIRVCRQMEHPSNEPAVLTGPDGMPMQEAVVSKEGVSGRYLNSEGVEGTEAWGKTARWVALYSILDGERITLAIFDHPENYGYPSHWHTRDYGLFAVNNLGARAFDESAQPVEYRLQPGESMIFKHRLHIVSGSHADAEELERVFEDFSKR